MSFTLNKMQGGKPICKINGGIYNNLIVYYVDKSLNDTTTNKKYQNFIYLKLEEGANFEPYPDTTIERQVISCFGCSGCGKSFFL